MESTRHSPSMPGRPWWRVVQEVSRAGAAQAARSVSAPGCLQHAQALGLDALPASSDLNRPVAYPRVPRGEGRAEGGAERWPRPSGKIDLWNAACELLCAAARGRAAPLQTWVRSSRLHLEHTPRFSLGSSGLELAIYAELKLKIHLSSASRVLRLKGVPPCLTGIVLKL
ncbi:uncharacterized protein LOC132648332 isoform X3 [Meriones unguiculatus]|uniref:uncharacterized protein LOC132648332 isoform X3 n=1 Tax=Meriones unguiculatus TaxID=10047 RepID=UPI00293F060C|nr:uncharacterized protein LOC132648332 isoform X3 [Meriones unguiculatus]